MEPPLCEISKKNNTIELNCQDIEEKSATVNAFESLYNKFTDIFLDYFGV
jgi:hypothetical protein